MGRAVVLLLALSAGCTDGSVLILPPELDRVTSGSVLLGVIGTLVYFHFGARQQADGTAKRNILVNILAWIGRIYIAITFGVLFAGVYMAALTALIERMDALRSYILVIRNFIAQ